MMQLAGTIETIVGQDHIDLPVIECERFGQITGHDESLVYNNQLWMIYLTVDLSSPLPKEHF